MNHFRNKLILEGLRAAKRWTSPTYHCGNLEQFICLALGRAERMGEITERVADLTRKVITDRLGGLYCLEEWLDANVGSDTVVAAMDQNQNAIQEYRHRWLDALIREFR